MDDAVRKSVPLVKISRGKRSRVPLGKGILASVQDKNRAWKKYIAENNTTNLRKYKVLRNKVRKLTRQEIEAKEDEISKCVKTNPKLFWSYVSQRTKRHEKIPQLKKPDGTVTESDQEKAEVISEFFSSVFVDEDGGLWEIPKVVHTLIDDNITFNVDDTMQLLSKLNISKSSGSDGIHPQVLRETRQTLVNI